MKSDVGGHPALGVIPPAEYSGRGPGGNPAGGPPASIGNADGRRDSGVDVTGIPIDRRPFFSLPSQRFPLNNAAYRRTVTVLMRALPACVSRAT
jgi:hypothetical protein